MIAYDRHLLDDAFLAICQTDPSIPVKHGARGKSRYFSVPLLQLLLLHLVHADNLDIGDLLLLLEVELVKVLFQSGRGLVVLLDSLPKCFLILSLVILVVVLHNSQFKVYELTHPDQSRRAIAGLTHS